MHMDTVTPNRWTVPHCGTDQPLSQNHPSIRLHGGQNAESDQFHARGTNHPHPKGESPTSMQPHGGQNAMSDQFHARRTDRPPTWVTSSTLVEPITCHLGGSCIHAHGYSHPTWMKWNGMNTPKYHIFIYYTNMMLTFECCKQATQLTLIRMRRVFPLVLNSLHSPVYVATKKKVVSKWKLRIMNHIDEWSLPTPASDYTKH